MNKKIYACYSPSHSPLLENHFLPSLPKGFDVVLRRFEQVCPSGAYKEYNWGEAVRNKVLFILDALSVEREPFVFSDVDVRFYSLTPDDLELEMSAVGGVAPDFKCQSDNGTYCAGFMFIRPCPATVRLFQVVLDNISPNRDDQDALNQIALPGMMSDLHRLSGLSDGSEFQASLLPHKKYWNLGTLWDGSLSLDGTEIPSDLAIHHGNYTIGVKKQAEPAKCCSGSARSFLITRSRRGTRHSH